MKSSRCLALLLFLTALLMRPALADDAPQLRVRAHLEPSGPVVAGTQVKLVVDCLTTTWFTEAPDWPLFTVPGAIVSFPDEQAENLHEVVDGVSWFGVSRAYRIAAQRGGALEVPSFAITLHPGGSAASVALNTPALELVATVPAGAQGMSVFFPTPRLTVTQKIEPSPSHLKVGDAFTRTITQGAQAIESMLIPPAILNDVDGLKRYPKPSVTRDIVQDRAGLVAGERTDSATYVVDRSGTFRLAPVTIEWWNTAAQKKETTVVPGVSFTATAAREKPLFGIPADTMARGAAHRIIVIDRWRASILFAILIVAGALVWACPKLARLYVRIRRAALAARKRYAEGDLPAWFALRRAARTASAPRIVAALYGWMDRNPAFERPARLDAFDTRGRPALEALVQNVRMRYSEHPADERRWSGTWAALGRLRKHARKTGHAQAPLPPLNP